jgi:hypothetical protein
MRTARALELLREQSELVSGDEFRVLFVGAQPDRVHVIVEAESNEAMTHGMSALTIRIARGFNKLAGRSGQVWDDRYRDRPLRTVKELREALDSFAAAPDDAAIIAKPQTSVARRM